MDQYIVTLEIVAFIAIVTIVGIFALVAVSIYMREVVAFKGKTKIDKTNGIVESEVAVAAIDDAKKEPPTK